MSLVDASGAAINKPSALTKLKIHEVEIPVPTSILDLKKEAKHGDILGLCQQPSLMPLQLSPGQQVFVIRGLTIGINGAEAMIVMETAAALDVMREEIADLKRQVEGLQNGS